MKIHFWEKAWLDKKFAITSLNPSILVERYAKKLAEGDQVLDVGCGNGRNSIYLAKLKCMVDCFDVADLGWTRSLPSEIKERISFTKSTISEYYFESDRYKAIVISRVIQYLDQEELLTFLKKCVKALKDDGFLLISYTAQGGIFARDEIQVQKFVHSIDYIKKILKERFKRVVITEGAKKNMHVNYEGDIVSYDLFVSGPIKN